MSTLKFPADIKKYVFKKIILRITACILLFILFALVFWMHDDFWFGMLSDLNRKIVHIILIVLPLAITGIPFKFIDYSWSGVIVKIKVKTSYDFNNNYARPSMRSLYIKNTVVLHIKTTSGRIIKRKAYEGHFKHQSQVDRYEIGMKVVHLYGTKFIQIVPQKDTDLRRCVICGLNNPQENQKCEICEHSVIL